jgi:hypothetical protein
MKKIVMMAVMAVAALSANAQVWICGEVGFNTSTNTVKVAGVSSDKTTNNFVIAPEIGYNLNEKWAVAMKIGYVHAGNNEEIKELINNYGVLPFNLGSTTTNAFTINPYARYTFVKAGNFSFFVDGGVGYSSVHVNGLSDYMKNINLIKVGINPGVTYAISPKVSLVAHVGDLSYQNMWSKAKNVDLKVSQGKFNIGLWNSISFGAYYNF